MSCYTMARVTLDDDRYTKKAIENLNKTRSKGSLIVVAEDGTVERRYQRAVKREAATLKSIAMVRRANPRAIIRRKGNQLTVTVEA